MREHKYRTWDKIENKMYFSDIIWWIDASKSYSMFSSEYHRLSLELSDLMDYIGLKDKNNIEIYEGDLIIQQDYTEPLEVYFCECCACFKARLNGFANIERIRGGECEVIGNIYENAELLK